MVGQDFESEPVNGEVLIPAAPVAATHTAKDCKSVLVNGEPAGQIAVTDRGLLYGDGLFETIAVRNGRPCLWREHLARLSDGARRLGIPMPDAGRWRDEARRLLVGCSTGVLKLILTRGVGERGYRPPASPNPTRILARSATPEWPLTWSSTKPDGGVTVRLCATPLASNPMLAGIKHLNRLEQVLARGEWSAPAIAEGLMCDGEGRLICGTMSNLFLLADGQVCTPRLHRCGVAGVLRALVLRECAALGVVARESDLALAELIAADGAFLTNALIGIWPIRQLGERCFRPAALPAQLHARVLTLAFTPEADW